MIEVTKVFTGDYDTAITIWFNSKNVEGKHDLRSLRFSILYHSPIQFDMCKFNFTDRIISVWISSPMLSSFAYR